jgi:hypothetical protein
LIASFSEGRWQQGNADTRRTRLLERVIVVRAISNLDNVEVNIVVARRGRERQFIL